MNTEEQKRQRTRTHTCTQQFMNVGAAMIFIQGKNTSCVYLYFDVIYRFITTNDFRFTKHIHQLDREKRNLEMNEMRFRLERLTVES